MWVDDGDVVVAQFPVGRSNFWLADEPPEHKNFRPGTLGGASTSMVLVFDDPDAVLQAGCRRGRPSCLAVEDQPYHGRVSRIVDPFGHYWEIGKSLA